MPAFKFNKLFKFVSISGAINKANWIWIKIKRIKMGKLFWWSFINWHLNNKKDLRLFVLWDSKRINLKKKYKDDCILFYKICQKCWL